MKRMLTAVIAGAALLVAAAPASAATTSSGDQPVTANVENSLEATFPTAFAWGALAPGVQTSAAQTITVKSNASWGMKAASDLIDGKMKEHDGTAYVATSPKVLTNALKVKLDTIDAVDQGTTFAALSSTEALLKGSLAATDADGAAVGIKYQQDVSYADRKLATTNYRVQVTYNASQGF